MSEDAEADAYIMDAETFGVLRRLVGRLRGDGPLVGDERRNLARMNALLQKAQPRMRARDDRKQALGIASLPTL